VSKLSIKLKQPQSTSNENPTTGTGTRKIEIKKKTQYGGDPTGFSRQLSSLLGDTDESLQFAMAYEQAILDHPQYKKDEPSVQRFTLIQELTHAKNHLERFMGLMTAWNGDDSRNNEYLNRPYFQKEDAFYEIYSEWVRRNEQTVNVEQKASTQYTCPKCKKNKTTFYQQQNRSSDEPMTAFISCLNCPHKWTEES